jgi:coenzyme F420-0:L-glutamate ligase/coenzyme F420-1:gamma-L-glutamate ligase
MARLSFTSLPDIGEVAAGDELAEMLVRALEAAGLVPEPNDVLIVAQKIVSKAEGRRILLTQIVPSARAVELARVTGKDPRLVEVILSESTTVLRARKDVLIVRHRMGWVMANAGVDRSNVGSDPDAALLLPSDPDASAAALREALAARTGVRIGVIISDSFGRAWRNGTTNIAIGAAGVPALVDWRGEKDRDGRRLEITQVAFADAVAAGAGLLIGEAAEGTPAVLARGLDLTPPEKPAASLIRPLAEDLFQ